MGAPLHAAAIAGRSRSGARRTTIAAALGLAAADIGLAASVLVLVGGPSATFVPVARLAAVADYRPDAASSLRHSAMARSICSAANA
jgi:predicted PhzF superfamily epimerase YddE/YHI9